MNAREKEHDSVNELRITTVTTAKEKPKYRKTAAELLSRCRGFYTDPENEKAFLEWKERQKHGDRQV